MPSTTAVYDIIKSLQAAKGLNAKKAILAENAHIPELPRFLKMTYDTHHNWYQTDIPAKQAGGVFSMFAQNKTFWDVANELFAKLPTRAATGNEALHLLTESVNSLCDEDVELLGYMIRRDIRAGAGPKTIVSVFDGLFPVWHYMRCETNKPQYREKLNWGKGVFSQVKADGMFAHGIYEDGEVTLWSREGNQTPCVGEPFRLIRAAFAEMKGGAPAKDFKTDGELLVMNIHSGVVLEREVGNGILNQWCQTGVWDDSNLVAVYDAWDIISLGEYRAGESATPYSERYKTLEAAISLNTGKGVRLIETEICFSFPEVLKHYRKVLRRGLEGLVIKCPDAPWKDGTSQKQLKIKPEVDVELRIKAYNPGEGKYADTFGSITCESECGRVRVNVGASSMSWLRHLEFWEHRDEFLEGIMTVRFTSILRNKKEGEVHSLFLPRYVDRRTDKRVADTFEQIVEQYNTKLGLNDSEVEAEEEAA